MEVATCMYGRALHSGIHAGGLSGQGVALEGSRAIAHTRAHVCRREGKEDTISCWAQFVYSNQRREDATCHCLRGGGME